jgi:hypothetical protein
MLLLIVTACESTGVDNDIENANEYKTDEVLYPKNSKLKRVLQVFSDNSVNEFYSYEYDESGRICKENSLTAYSYGVYEYDTKSLLTSISHFFVSPQPPASPVLERKHTYIYDETGNKIKETIERFTDPEGSEYTLYKYEDKKLVRSEHYTQDKNDFYILYQYNDAGEMIRENLAVPGAEGEDPVITEHTYQAGLLVYSITYSGEKTNLMRDSRKIYDLNDNLVMTIDNMPGLSSTYPGKPFYETRRYEYFK